MRCPVRAMDERRPRPTRGDSLVGVALLRADRPAADRGRARRPHARSPASSARDRSRATSGSCRVRCAAPARPHRRSPWRSGRMGSTVDDRWAETDFGAAEGLTFDELEAVAARDRVAAGRGETRSSTGREAKPPRPCRNGWRPPGATSPSNPDRGSSSRTAGRSVSRSRCHRCGSGPGRRCRNHRRRPPGRAVVDLIPMPSPRSSGRPGDRC